MRWQPALFCFGFGFGCLLGQPERSPTKSLIPRLEKVQLSELEIPQQTAQQKQAELATDQKTFTFVNEQAMLWTRMANAQDEFFTLKWNNGVTNLALQTEMKFIRKELLDREKEVSKFLRK